MIPIHELINWIHWDEALTKEILLLAIMTEKIKKLLGHRFCRPTLSRAIIFSFRSQIRMVHLMKFLFNGSRKFTRMAN